MWISDFRLLDPDVDAVDGVCFVLFIVYRKCLLVHPVLIFYADKFNDGQSEFSWVFNFAIFGYS